MSSNQATKRKDGDARDEEEARGWASNVEVGLKLLSVVFRKWSIEGIAPLTGVNK